MIGKPEQERGFQARPPSRAGLPVARGRRGEQLAAKHLSERGMQILACNVRTRNGEIDLIARDRRTLVFVEVKTRCVRSSDASIREDQLPLAGLGGRQRARVRRLALAWLRERRVALSGIETIRFDAVGVVIDARDALLRLEHVEAAW